ncbi:PEP-CTERM sorting domain-containing protein [Comamonadaceae bacterium G21597-S1]|nr:PEP-CTERM sorting domain-containing protein [Comamonadaceae bacterium G21597-S1]
MIRTSIAGLVLLPALVSAAGNAAASTYLNQSNITVTVGAGTSPGSFNNTFSGGSTIAKVIDAPSAIAEEFHNQTTHIWYTADDDGGGLELLFDFGIEYDLSVLHFWNYTSETYDVDNVAFTFFNGNNVQNGMLSVTPELGSSPGIRAQDIALAAPLNVRYVTAFLTGSNRQVDFQNIGFTANVSAPVPEPATYAMLGLGSLLVLAAWRRKRWPDPGQPAVASA